VLWNDPATGVMRHADAGYDRGFTRMTSSSDPAILRNVLFMLDCVIPMMMRVLYRHGGYVEKNTGDGLMAILGVDKTDSEAADAALDAAEEMFFVLSRLVNPLLEANQISPVDARVGIDLGELILARIGLPTGSSRHERNTLTAVGPSANIASRLQTMAGTNEIWCGESVQRASKEARQASFLDVTPDNWTWKWGPQGRAYRCWNYLGVLQDPANVFRRNFI
jgi:adenylate cyclase